MDKEEQLKNKQVISLILFKFHFEISGKYFKLLQLLNKPPISLTFLIFHPEISGNETNCLQS